MLPLYSVPACNSDLSGRGHVERIYRSSVVPLHTEWATSVMNEILPSRAVRMAGRLSNQMRISGMNLATLHREIDLPLPSGFRPIRFRQGCLPPGCCRWRAADEASQGIGCLSAMAPSVDACVRKRISQSVFGRLFIQFRSWCGFTRVRFLPPWNVHGIWMN